MKGMQTHPAGKGCDKLGATSNALQETVGGRDPGKDRVIQTDYARTNSDRVREGQIHTNRFWTDSEKDRFIITDEHKDRFGADSGKDRFRQGQIEARTDSGKDRFRQEIHARTD
ncbi:hypothetical protein Bpfe_029502 [Biomphalaria pfeifferi]|uniref:Uncharacterized protein n=1 Tax=Biomphalaria pfeifferi TaxID=112525 RepID=A0AAD8ARJ7_BIOPF|nr:hypothetical protein Bpfe_029502 [Biomphalaria pfeifferi]